MDADRRDPFDREFAERLLSGEPVEAGHEALQQVMGALTGPAHADELAGEEAAVTAFREARANGGGREDPVVRAPVAKLLSIKLAALAGAVTLLGGVAVAAGTGSIPSVPGGDEPKTEQPARHRRATAEVPGTSPGAKVPPPQERPASPKPPKAEAPKAPKKDRPKAKPPKDRRPPKEKAPEHKAPKGKGPQKQSAQGIRVERPQGIGIEVVGTL